MLWLGLHDIPLWVVLRVESPASLPAEASEKS